MAKVSEATQAIGRAYWAAARIAETDSSKINEMQALGRSYRAALRTEGFYAPEIGEEIEQPTVIVPDDDSDLDISELEALGYE